MDYSKTGPETDALFDRAERVYYERRYAEAVLLFKKLLKEHRESVCEWHTRWWIGLAYSGMEDNRKAIKYLEPALKGALEESEYRPAFLIGSRLGYSYFHVGKYEKSANYYRLAERHIGHCDSDDYGVDRYYHHLGKGRCGVYLKRYEEAVNEFDKARAEISREGVGDEVDRAMVNYETARAYYLHRKIEPALKFFEKVEHHLLDDSNQADYHFYFSSALDEDDNVMSAFKEASKIKIEHVSDSFKADVYNLLGRLCYQRGDWEQARVNLRLSLKHKFTSPWVHQNSRMYLSRLGEEV